MTKLEVTESRQLIKITSDNKFLLDAIKNSPSRIWKYGTFYYPVQEFMDIIKYTQLLNEPYEIDPIVRQEIENFNLRLNILQRIKNNDLKDIDLSKPKGFKTELFERQKKIAAQVLLMRRQLLALEVGMGKTIISLFVIFKLRQLSNIKALVVCEANQIPKTWVNTILDFTDVKPVVIEGDKTKRLYTLNNISKNDWLFVTSYETIRITPEISKNWDIIVYDEITKVKNASAKTSKALQELNAQYKIGLSGTPIKNSYLDLYGILKIINPYIFTTKANFIQRYIVLDFFKRPIGLQKTTEAELRQKVDPWIIQQTKSDVNIEKPIHIKTLPVNLVPLQIKELEKIKEYILTGEKSPFECQTTLRQICNTVKLLDEYKDLPIEETTNKMSVLKNLLNELVKEKSKKVLIFSFFKEAVDIIYQELCNDYRIEVITGDTKKSCKFQDISNCFLCSYYKNCESIKRKIFDFVEGDYQILLGTDSLSRSHDIYTCDTLINFDLPWTDADLVQRIGRVDRGEKNKAPEFFVYNLATLGTIEEKIIKIIERKATEGGKIFPKFSVKMRKLSATIVTKG
jgi:non-specific serine/threonine protein kinase